MSKFAKLYERDGKQLLVTKESDELPELHLRTTTRSGHSVTLKFGFKDGDWDKRDKTFDDMTENAAWGIIDKSPGIDI